MNLNDLFTFSIVARFGTITKAARQLEIPKSTVSRRIKRLEDSLAIELFHRSPKQMVLTQDGRSFFERTSGLLDELLASEQLLKESKDEPNGTLRITTTEGYAQNPSILSCLASYLTKYPKVKIELLLTSRITHLVDEQIDIGLRLHTGVLPGESNLMSRSLQHISSAIYASPAYLQENPAITHIQQLAEHDFVAFTGVSFSQKPWLYAGQPFTDSLPFRAPKMSVNSTAILLHCALNGIGLCILDIASAQAHVERGELVRVLPNVEQQIAKSSIVWVASKHLSLKVRTFINHATQFLSAV